MDFLVVEREHHLDLLRDPLEGLIGLYFGDEGEHIGLHDADLNTGPLVDGVDVLHGSFGGVHAQVDAVRLAERLEIEAELIIGAFLASRHHAHVRREGEGDGADRERQGHHRDE